MSGNHVDQILTVIWFHVATSDSELTVTFVLWVSPEQLSTLAACSSPEAGLTGTLTADLWTKSSESFYAELHQRNHENTEAGLTARTHKVLVLISRL